MRKWMMGAALPALLGACSSPEPPPAPVAADDGPLYCYQSLAKVSCYRTPAHRDERRLVNYVGPTPESYPKPPQPPEPVLYAPAQVNYFVKDPEPVPQAAPPPAAAAPERPVARSAPLPPPRRAPTKIAPPESTGAK